MELAYSLVGGENVSDLLPRVVHVFLGIRLDDRGAEGRWDPEARVEIQPVNPVRIVRGWCAVAVRQQPLRQSVPAAVEGRRDQRIGIVGNTGAEAAGGVGVARGLRGICVRKVDKSGHRLLERVRIGLIQFS